MVAKQSHRIKICIHRITFPNSNSMYALDDQSQICVLQFEHIFVVVTRLHPPVNAWELVQFLINLVKYST